MRHSSVILLSGGLDSAANLALSHDLDQPVLAITVRYGQRAQEREVQAAKSLSHYYQVEHRVLDLPWLGALGGNALTDSSQKVPELRQSQLDDLSIITGSAKSVWVPNRNGILINVASAFAESLGAKRVVVGFNREEAATFPDNSVAFLNCATGALEYSTANHVQVFSYTSELNKIEIVQGLRELKKTFPFEKVWSCYYGGEKPCGKCESCGRYDRAVQEAEKDIRQK